jgi:hypothetical protein
MWTQTRKIGILKIHKNNQILTPKNYNISLCFLTLLQIINFIQIAITKRGNNQIQLEIIKQMNLYK